MRCTTRKPGIATLELVMCMPVLLVMMVGIVWLGFSVVGQSQVAIEARNAAWKKRFDDNSQPLNFIAEDYYVTEDATTEISVSPLLDDVAPPESSHDVANGTWDHDNVDLNRAPSWQLYLTAALNAQTAGLQVVYTDLRNTVTEMQNLGRQLVVQQIQNLIKEFLDDPLAQFKGGADNAKDESERRAEREKRKITQEIESTRAEIDQVEDRIDELTKQKRDAEDDEIKESLESRIRMNRNKRKRLQAQLARLRADRRAMND